MKTRFLLTEERKLINTEGGGPHPKHLPRAAPDEKGPGPRRNIRDGRSPRASIQPPASPDGGQERRRLPLRKQKLQAQAPGFSPTDTCPSIQLTQPHSQPPPPSSANTEAARQEGDLRRSNQSDTHSCLNTTMARRKE